MTACGGQTSTEEPTGDNKVATEGLTNDGNYVFASGGTSGTYFYPLAGAIATLVNEQASVNATVQSTGASKENVMLISQDEADFAIIQNDVLIMLTTEQVCSKKAEK